MTGKGNMRRHAILSALIAALIASPIPWLDVHAACEEADVVRAVPEAAPAGAEGSTPDAQHLHLDQCCHHPQAGVQAPPALCFPPGRHAEPRLIDPEVLAGALRSPYRPPIR